MTIFGYCRISTRQQSIERQIRNIKKEYPAAVIFQEAFTGTKIDRPVFNRLIARVKADDAIVFDSVSRMSRSAEEGWLVYEDLFNRGVSLIFLKEHHIDTATYKKSLDGLVAMTGTNADFILRGVNDYLKALAKEQIRLAFAQSAKEVEDLHERTREGIQTARINGKQIGGVRGRKLKVKKSEPAKKQILEYSRDFNGTLSDSDCIKICGLSRNTYYKYKRELKYE